MESPTASQLTNPMNDSQLLDAIGRGDRSALDELFQRYRHVAYRVAYRLLGNEADALDAVQEGFVKALTHLSGFQGRSSFKTWLIRIVSNASLDLGRQRRRRDLPNLETSVTRDADLSEPSVYVEPGRDLDHRDLRQSLDAALAELPEAQRRTFILHIDGELSYREVADILGISIGTVMSRLFYARQKLRGLLAAHAEP